MGIKYKHKLAVIELSTRPKAQATKNCFRATENSQSTRRMASRSNNNCKVQR